MLDLKINNIITHEKMGVIFLFELLLDLVIKRKSSCEQHNDSMVRKLVLNLQGGKEEEDPPGINEPGRRSPPETVFLTDAPAFSNGADVAGRNGYVMMHL